MRFLASGPDAGLAEIELPSKQAGSSIMPGKVNPVIPEAVVQAAMTVLGNDVVITQASAGGNLELNQFMPLIACKLLESIDLLDRAADMLRLDAVQGMKANEEQCTRNVLNSTALITAVITLIGYEKASELVKKSKTGRITVLQAILDSGWITRAELDELISPEAVCRLGFV